MQDWQLRSLKDEWELEREMGKMYPASGPALFIFIYLLPVLKMFLGHVFMLNVM